MPQVKYHNKHKSSYTQIHPLNFTHRYTHRRERERDGERGRNKTGTWRKRKLQEEKTAVEW